MTDKILNEYYSKHKDIYVSLAKNCTSVAEILLKLEIYGKQWTQWDWTLFFSNIIECMFIQDTFQNNKNENLFLFKDIIETIDNSDMLDKIITNKQVILNIIYVINGNTKFMTQNLKIKLCTLLAHIFKKFPYMWNMSWMYAKFRDVNIKRWCKYHRLKNTVYISSYKDLTESYYKSKKYYEDFISSYLIQEKEVEK